MTTHSKNNTDVATFMDDLDGGMFANKLGKALSEAAGGCVDFNKEAAVTLTFKLKRIGNSYQVGIQHKIAYTVPTQRGKVTEEDTTETPMHVGTGGRMTVFPENQHQMFGRKGEPTASQTNPEKE